MARLLEQACLSALDTKPILEVNPEHTLVKKQDDATRFDDQAQVLFDRAVLAEGGQLDDPVGYVQRMTRLLTG